MQGAKEAREARDGRVAGAPSGPGAFPREMAFPKRGGAKASSKGEDAYAMVWAPRAPAATPRGRSVTCSHLELLVQRSAVQCLHDLFLSGVFFEA